MYLHSIVLAFLFSISKTTPSIGIVIMASSLFGLGQADGVVAQVINTVPLAQERVTKNGQGANGLGEVHAHEATDAGALDLQNVVVWADGEVVAAQSEGEVGQAVASAAFHGVLTSEGLLGTDLLVQELSKSRGQSNERGTGIKDDTSVVKLGNAVTESNSIQVNLPVGLAAEGDLDELASVVVLVDTTEGSLGVIALLVGVTQVEGEDRLIQEALVQHVVKGRDHLVNRDGVITQTQNTIESAEGKGQSRLASSLSEVLLLDLQVADLQSILRDETAQATGTILDGKLGAVLLVCARRRGVIFAVEEASNRTALRGWNPQVGTTCVKNDLEGLGRGTDFNLGEV